MVWAPLVVRCVGPPTIGTDWWFIGWLGTLVRGMLKIAFYTPWLKATEIFGVSIILAISAVTVFFGRGGSIFITAW